MVADVPQAWLLVGLISVAAALAAVALVMAVEAAGDRRRRRGVRDQLQRLGSEMVAAGGPSLLRERREAVTDTMERLAGRLLGFARPQLFLEQAGMSWGVSTFLSITAGAAIGAGVVVLLATGEILFALPAAGLGLLLPRWHVGRKRARRMAHLEEQLPEAIDLLSRSIRAGHAVSSALTMLVEESPEPIAGEFRRIVDEQRFGLPFEESLMALIERIPLVDVRIFATAVMIQREVGGNLTEILDKLSFLIRQRFTLQRQVMVLTAEGRLSAIILAVLPSAVGLFMLAVNPDYMMLMLDNPAGQKLVVFALAMQLFGYIVAKRMVKLDY
jgi:tight adherence protein B